MLNALMAQAMTLKERLQEAASGDFVVMAHKKVYTLFHVQDKQAGRLTIEEISVPAARLTFPINWQAWLQEGAPGNTNWLLYTVNLASGRVENSYSVADHAWVNLSQDHFLSTLLNLPLNRIPDSERKRRGVSQRPGGPDTRPFWQPKLVFGGRPVEGVPFSAWTTRWPKDGSVLSGKWIEAYLPDTDGRFVSYLPYWLQVSGNIQNLATIYIIDSGKNLQSPMNSYPQPMSSVPQ